MKNENSNHRDLSESINGMVWYGMVWYQSMTNMMIKVKSKAYIVILHEYLGELVDCARRCSHIIPRHIT